jgi:hypothetical protein
MKDILKEVSRGPVKKAHLPQPEANRNNETVLGELPVSLRHFWGYYKKRSDLVAKQTFKLQKEQAKILWAGDIEPRIKVGGERLKQTRLERVEKMGKNAEFSARIRRLEAGVRNLEKTFWSLVCAQFDLDPDSRLDLRKGWLVVLVDRRLTQDSRR